MELLSREYGWTPAEIRAQSAQDIEQYLVIIGERARIERARSLRGITPR